MLLLMDPSLYIHRFWMVHTNDVFLCVSMYFYTFLYCIWGGTAGSILKSTNSAGDPTAAFFLAAAVETLGHELVTSWSRGHRKRLAPH